LRRVRVRGQVFQIAGALVGGLLVEPVVIFPPDVVPASEASFDGPPAALGVPVELGDGGEFSADVADTAELLKEVLVGVEVLRRDVGRKAGHDPQIGPVAGPHVDVAGGDARVTEELVEGDVRSVVTGVAGELIIEVGEFVHGGALEEVAGG
jgi:hypothetical protein